MTTGLNNLLRCLLAVSISAAATLAHAQLFKWVDEQGRTHYSDRKPDDAKASEKVKAVKGNLSVYSPDKPLLAAVEVARERASRPAPVYEPPPQPYVAPAALPAQDPCAQQDCAPAYFPAFPAAGVLRRRVPPRLVQAQFPPGAIAGTVNSPGIIPGNTGTTPSLPPRQTFNPPRRIRSGTAYQY